MSNYRRVIIEGTLFPAAGVLPRGERDTVAYTEHIERLVRGGHVKIIEFLDDAVDVVEEHTVDVTDAEGPVVDVEEPPRNGSTAAWAAFLANQGFDVPEGVGRDDLIAIWDARENGPE